MEQSALRPGKIGIAIVRRTRASIRDVELMANTRAAGLAIGTANEYIAATNGVMIATRDTHPFEAAGVSVVNPGE